ncbi:MAG: hypothetical protein ACE5HU_06565 [Acidobacteriota bacterium]
MASSERVCGAILEELKRHMTRERVGIDDENAYLDQELLAERLHKDYRITMMPEQLNAPLTILKDAGYVKYRRIAIGPPGRRRHLTAWRITGDGIRLLEGDIQDGRVSVLFW